MLYFVDQASNVNVNVQKALNDLGKSLGGLKNGGNWKLWICNERDKFRDCGSFYVHAIQSLNLWYRFGWMNNEYFQFIALHVYFVSCITSTNLLNWVCYLVESNTGFESCRLQFLVYFFKFVSNLLHFLIL